MCVRERESVCVCMCVCVCVCGCCVGVCGCCVGLFFLCVLRCDVERWIRRRGCWRNERCYQIEGVVGGRNEVSDVLILLTSVLHSGGSGFGPCSKQAQCDPDSLGRVLYSGGSGFLPLLKTGSELSFLFSRLVGKSG